MIISDTGAETAMKILQNRNMYLFMNVIIYDAAGAFLDTSTVESVTIYDFVIQIE